jgi:hypothetical protein
MPGQDDPESELADDRPSEAALPAEVVARRAEADERDQRLAPAVDAHLEAVLDNCRTALQWLAEQHAYLADHSDLDLDGATRWAARWQLAGAAIAYANALVDLSDGGYVDPALPVSRSLYEALGLLGVVNDDAEQTILDRWLEDREVQPKKVRAAAERQARRVQQEAAAQSVDLDVGDVSELMQGIYSPLSDVSHVRRSGVRGMISGPLRRANYGRHPDPGMRSQGAASTVLAVEATIMGVGDVLAMFYGGPYYREVIKPVQDGVMESAAQLMALTAR